MESKAPIQPKQGPANAAVNRVPAKAPAAPVPSSPAAPAPVKADKPAAPPMVWPKAPSGMTPSVPQRQGHRPLNGNTIFGAHLGQFKKPAAEGLSPLQSTAPSRSFSAVRIRNEELKTAALGDKGLKPDQMHLVLEFVEWARQSSRHLEEDSKRAALTQMLGFWVKQLAPHVPSPPNVALEAFRGAA